MSQLDINSTPLFRTSLRAWQAHFKARQAAAGNTPAAPQPSRQLRLVLRKRRPRSQAGGETS